MKVRVDSKLIHPLHIGPGIPARRMLRAGRHELGVDESSAAFIVASGHEEAEAFEFPPTWKRLPNVRRYKTGNA